MINLIKNEFIKSYKKKGIIIMIGVIIVYAILSNFLYSQFDNVYDDMDEEYYSKISKDDYDLTSESELEDYISDKSVADVYKLRKEYDKDSWQYAYISEYNFYDYFLVFNSYEHGLIDKETYEKTLSDYNSFLTYLNSNNWKLIVEKENEMIKEEIDTIKSDGGDENLIKSLEIDLEVNNLRLSKDIPFGYNSYNTNLEDYRTSKIELLYFDDVSKLKNSEKSEYYGVREIYLMAEYSILNNIETDEYGTSNYILKNFVDEYFLMLLIFIFMISGSITSQEFNKGTIKLLLLRPYSRIKILLSKYIVSLSSIFISFVVIFFIQIILGIVILDIESLSQPVLMYNFNSDSIQVYNIFVYVILNFLAYLPQFIILCTLTFAISTITANTSLAMILGFVVYLGSSIFDTLLYTVENWWQKIIYVFHWDLSPYIFNYNPRIVGCNALISILVCIVYLIIILVPTFIIFKKKDIKNI